MKLREQQFVTEELITQSSSRFTLFNLDYQYEYASLENAGFHQTDPADFVGRRVVDFIRDQRFSQRAKQYHDRYFAWVRQKYSYFLKVAVQGERLMDYLHKPYPGADGYLRGTFFTVEDQTDKIEHATRSALSNQVN